jgi:hypothetical protein
LSLVNLSVESWKGKGRPLGSGRWRRRRGSVLEDWLAYRRRKVRNLVWPAVASSGVVEGETLSFWLTMQLIHMQLQSGLWTVILQSAATQPRNPQILDGARLPCPPDLCLEVDGFVLTDGEVSAAMVRRRRGCLVGGVLE